MSERGRTVLADVQRADGAYAVDARLEDVRTLRAQVVTAHVQRYVGGGLVTRQTQQQVPESITIPFVSSKSTVKVRLLLPRLEL